MVPAGDERTRVPLNWRLQLGLYGMTTDHFSHTTMGTTNISGNTSSVNNTGKIVTLIHVSNMNFWIRIQIFIKFLLPIIKFLFFDRWFNVGDGGWRQNVLMKNSGCWRPRLKNFCSYPSEKIVQVPFRSGQIHFRLYFPCPKSWPCPKSEKISCPFISGPGLSMTMDFRGPR